MLTVKCVREYKTGEVRTSGYSCDYYETIRHEGGFWFIGKMNDEAIAIEVEIVPVLESTFEVNDTGEATVVYVINAAGKTVDHYRSPKLVHSPLDVVRVPVQ